MTDNKFDDQGRDLWQANPDFWKWVGITFGKGTAENMCDYLDEGEEPHYALATFIDQVARLSAERQADAAIAAAEPIIRAKLLAELIARAEAEGIAYVWSGYAESEEECTPFDEWINAREDADHG